MAEMKGGEYRLRLGQVVIGLRLDHGVLVEGFTHYFDQPSDPAEPDVDLALHVDSKTPPAPVPNSLILTKTVQPDGFEIAEGLVRGRYDPATGRGELTIQPHLLAGRLVRVFEQLIYQAFHAACRRRDYDACLVHSCGVVRDGQGHLFVGAPGAGKSTVAELSTEYDVLNDEMNLVEFRASGPVLVGVPFNGFFENRARGEAPLHSVYLLAHGEHHGIATVGSGEAASVLAAQIAPPVPLDGVADQSTSMSMLETAFRLAGSVPVRRLEFRRDPGFWQTIDDSPTEVMP